MSSNDSLRRVRLNTAGNDGNVSENLIMKHGRVIIQYILPTTNINARKNHGFYRVVWDSARFLYTRCLVGSGLTQIFHYVKNTHEVTFDCDS